MVPDVVIHVPEKTEQPTFAGWRMDLPRLLSSEHLSIITPKFVAWFSRYVILWLDMLWLYQTQGLYMIYASDTDVNKNSHGGCSWKAGQKIIYITLSFNLVRVRCLAILYFTSRPKTLNEFQVFLYHLYGLYLSSYSLTIFKVADHIVLDKRLLMTFRLNSGRKLSID